MKLQSHQLFSFLPKLGNEINAILIFGPEMTEVQSTLKRIIDHLKKLHGEDLNIVKLSYSDLKDSPMVLKEEIATQYLFFTKKVLLIDGAVASIHKSLPEVLRSASPDSILIFIANDIAKGSPCRKLFEEQVHLAAIACYKPDENRIRFFVNEALKAHSVTATRDFIDVVMEMLPANESIIQSELKKLFLYLGDRKEVVADDIIALSGGNMDFSLDDLLEALLKGDKKQVAKELQKLENAGENAIFIIRVILNFFMRLIRLKLMLMEGKNLENALLRLKPPAFFKNRNNLIIGIKKYQLTDLQKIVRKFTELELLTKKGIINPELLVNQALLVF